MRAKKRERKKEEKWVHDDEVEEEGILELSRSFSSARNHRLHSPSLPHFIIGIFSRRSQHTTIHARFLWGACIAGMGHPTMGMGEAGEWMRGIVWTVVAAQ